jgi:hypothetical protein
LQKGVTDDYFWYEGSIHYNYFTLEGITNLLLFSKLYDYDFKVGAEVIEKMLISAYEYAFDNHSLPNPNDGWPDVNLKTYSYIYALGARIYGEESRVANLFKNIVNKETERATIPLSKPYYFENDISLEEYIFVPNLRKEKFAQEKSNPISFPTSYCGKIKNDRFELFYKYGHNGPSHAHPDKMTIEVSIDNKVVSRDLSNSGYGNVYCNEWHRVSASHNTCVLNGQNHKSTDKGEIHLNEDNHVIVTSNNVYEGIDYKRELKITDNQLKDQFTVSGTENDVVDYFLHFEGDLSLSENLEPASLVFDQNGYQHIEDVKKVISKSDDITLTVYIDDIEFNVKCNTKGKELFITKTPDNPITNLRSTLILRSKEKDPVFDLLWEL